VAKTVPIRPRRTVLYVPGSNARALAKAENLPVDCVILDLEDSVIPEAKAEARVQARGALIRTLRNKRNRRAYQRGHHRLVA
jgi:citrate lyase beta subunit